MAILKSLNVIWFLFSLTLVSSTWSLAVKERLSMCSRFTGSLQAFFFSSNADPTSNSVNQFPMSKLPALPSINSEYYSMLISQSLRGISSNDFQSEYYLNSLAFTAAVAESLPGINYDDIKVTSVTDTSVHRLRYLANEPASIIVNYTISYNIASLGYSDDPTGCYEYLLNELTSAISDSDFNSFLYLYSQIYHADLMSNITSGGVMSSSYIPQSETTNNLDYDDPLSNESNTSRIIIIVACALGGCCLISLAMCCWCFGSNRGGGQDTRPVFEPTFKPEKGSTATFESDFRSTV